MLWQGERRKKGKCIGLFREIQVEIVGYTSQMVDVAVYNLLVKLDCGGCNAGLPFLENFLTLPQIRSLKLESKFKSGSFFFAQAAATQMKKHSFRRVFLFYVHR